MIEYKYGDFTYRLNARGSYEVISDKEEPISVFKYYANNSNSQDAIMNQFLFCSHPYHLNDSMDCSSLLWDFSNITKEKYESFYKHIGFDKSICVGFEEDSNRNFREFRQLLFNYTSIGAGIISLTTNSLHTLMWSHYASERGFMLELNLEKLKSSLNSMNKKLNNFVFFPIQYVNNLENIDFFNIEFKGPDLPYLYSIAIKRNDWEYEEEWRLVPFSTNYGIPDSLVYAKEDIKGEIERKLFYPKEAIESIVLGKNFFNGFNIKAAIKDFTYSLKHDVDLEFVKYLCENFNDRIYFCGEYEADKKFVRSAERIEFEKIDEDTFKIVRMEEIFIQD